MLLSRRCFILAIPFLLIAWPVRAAVTGLTNVNIPSTTFEATTSNDIVMHLSVHGSDSLQSVSLDNVAGYLQAKQPQDLSAVRLLYDADGNTANGSTTLGAFSVDASNLHWTLSLPSPVPVSDGDHLFVSVDVQGPASILGGTRVVHMSVPSGGISFTSGTLPSSPLDNPSDLYLTSQVPPLRYDVSLTDTMPATVGVGQSGVPLLQLDCASDSTPGHSYDAGVFLQRVRVVLYDGAAPVSPGAVLASMSVSSPQDGTEYFNASDLSSYSSGVTLDLPLTLLYADGPSFGPTYPNSLVFKADLLPSVSLTGLRAVLLDASDLTGVDSYSRLAVPASGAFPLQTSSSVFQHAATVVGAAFTASGATAQVPKGSSGNLAFQAVLNNPGAANTGVAQLNTLAFTLTDDGGNPVTATTALRWVRVDDGRFTYLSRAVNEASGNAVTCSLTFPVNLAAGNPVTLNVKYDVLAGALPYHLRFRVDSLDGWSVSQAGTTTPVSITASLPFQGPDVPIVTLCQVSHSPRIPSLLVKGQKDVPFMDLTFQHPGPAPVGPLVLRALTFRLLDRNGRPVQAASALDHPRLLLGENAPSQSAQLEGDRVLLSLTDGVTLNSSDPGTEAVLSLVSGIAGACPADSLALQLDSSAGVSAIQPADTSRVVFAQATADAYPMSSGTAPLQAIDLQSSFTNYPNPFQPKRGPTRFTYWLPQEAKVTLRLFSLSGAPVRKVVQGENRPAGLQTADTWNGKNESGQTVLNGVYLAVLETESAGHTTTVKRFVAVAK